MIPSWNTSSGNLASINENELFSFFLSFNMVPAGTAKIISGNLPNGLNMDSTGAIIGTPTTEITKHYTFTVRLENTSGISDRTFSIEVLKANPFWVSPSIITEYVPPDRDFRNRQVIDYNLEVGNTSGNIKYELVSGRLPDGVSLREDGKITGYIKDRQNAYIFTVRADTIPEIEKTFQLNIIDDGENRPPFWSTLLGWLGDIRQGVHYQFNLRGDDSDNDPVSFSLKSGSTLPDGINFSSNGFIYGTLTNDITVKHSFIVIITDGTRNIEREFFLRCNYEEVEEDIWITNPIDPNNPSLLGILEIDEDASLKINTQFSSRWVRYEISSGSLPNGLSLNINTGDIEGTVLFGTEGNYEFQVRVYNESLIETLRTFTITIKNRIEYRPKRISVILTGYSRRQFNEYFYNYVIPYEDIYRPSDKNFGIKISNELIIKKYADFSSKSELYNVLENKHYTSAKPTQFKYVPVVNSNSNVICEAIYLHFNDVNNTVLRDTTNNQNVTNLDLMRYWFETNLNSPIETLMNWHTGWYNTDLDNNIFISQNHDLYTGKEIFFKNQNIPSPFLNGVVYYVIKIDNNSFRLAYSYQMAQQGNYIQFNINDTNRGGVYYSHHNGIPIAFVNNDRGEAIAQRLNNSFSSTFSNITLDVNFVVHGPTQSKIQEDLEMLFFSNGVDF